MTKISIIPLSYKEKYNYVLNFVFNKNKNKNLAGPWRPTAKLGRPMAWS
jgi:hypothetical protein